MKEPAVIISLIGLAIAIIAGYIKLRERLVAIEVKVSLFWDSISKDAAKILHTPHPENARRDYLLEQFTEAKITRDELKELVSLLKSIIEDTIKDFGERSAASTLLRAIQIQYEI